MTLAGGPRLRVGLLQEKINAQVRCLVCGHRCVISPGKTGVCGTRRNIAGTIYTLIDGLISSLSANPIEKKPLFHFYPGSVALTAGSWGCNFACPWCQNWSISKMSPPEGAPYMSPEAFVRRAKVLGCQGTSVSFNEPTLLLEWSRDVFRLAHSQGLYNTFVTNGYMSPEALQLLAESGLDALNVDLKGDAATVRQYCKAKGEWVWRCCLEAKKRGLHLEVTTLVIPGVNDSEETLRGIAQRIALELGKDTPWHCSRYFPAYQFGAPPTPMAAVERAWQIGRGEGLEFVYVGNSPGHKYENTYCPGCGGLLIGRLGLSITHYCLVQGRCPSCGRQIPVVGSLAARVGGGGR